MLPGDVGRQSFWGQTLPVHVPRTSCIIGVTCYSWLHPGGQASGPRPPRCVRFAMARWRHWTVQGNPGGTAVLDARAALRASVGSLDWWNVRRSTLRPVRARGVPANRVAMRPSPWSPVTQWSCSSACGLREFASRLRSRGRPDGVGSRTRSDAWPETLAPTPDLPDHNHNAWSEADR